MVKGGMISFESRGLWPPFSALQSTLIDRFGRKVLLWGGYTLMCSVLALLTMTLSLQVRGSSLLAASPAHLPALNVQDLYKNLSQRQKIQSSAVLSCVWWFDITGFSLSASVFLDALLQCYLDLSVRCLLWDWTMWVHQWSCWEEILYCIGWQHNWQRKNRLVSC